MATEKVKVKIARPFMYNGQMVVAGAEVEMNENRAVNHMRVGDVERQEKLVERVKQRRLGAAKAAQKDAEGKW